jgi:hypothetical protein
MELDMQDYQFDHMEAVEEMWADIQEGEVIYSHEMADDENDCDGCGERDWRCTCGVGEDEDEDE